jgi:NAD(P)-dependent dehydrogenase (short-subunit alcohol dehydrogenase family)
MAAPKVDMSGKTVMITGFTAGVGKAATFALAEMGADLVGVCRNAEKGKAVVEEVRQKTGVRNLEMFAGDLGLQRDVRRVAGEFLATGRLLHVLFNNAGVVMQRRDTTAEGLEMTFAVNHLGYFLLTNLLIESLRAGAPSRVVCTASDAHKFAGREIDFDDLQSESSYSTFGVYGKSKLCNILFARELARREAENGVSAYAFHPGFVGSDFAKNNGALASALVKLISPFARSTEKGAETGVYLCTSPGITEASGGYFQDMKPNRPSKVASSDDVARRLWEASAELTQLEA